MKDTRQTAQSGRQKDERAGGTEEGKEHWADREFSKKFAGRDGEKKEIEIQRCATEIIFPIPFTIFRISSSVSSVCCFSQFMGCDRRLDEFGRPMTTKEAWRQLNHAFHGKAPGAKAQERRKKQYLEELKVVKQIRIPIGLVQEACAG